MSASANAIRLEPPVHGAIMLKTPLTAGIECPPSGPARVLLDGVAEPGRPMGRRSCGRSGTTPRSHARSGASNPYGWWWNPAAPGCAGTMRRGYRDHAAPDRRPLDARQRTDLPEPGQAAAGRDRLAFQCLGRKVADFARQCPTRGTGTESRRKPHLSILPLPGRRRRYTGTARVPSSPRSRSY